MSDDEMDLTKIAEPDYNVLQQTSLEQNIQPSNQGSFFSNISWFRYFLIILILAFLGINLFGYLELVTNYIVTTFKPLLAPIASFFGISIAETTNNAVDVTSMGLKKGIDITGETIKKGTQLLEKAVTPNTLKENNENLNNDTIIDKLNNDLNDKNNKKSKLIVEPLPDNSSSLIQNNKKKNFCYIGVNNDGRRTCAEMNDTDKCMSGNIFPNLNVCINPNLR